MGQLFSQPFPILIFGEMGGKWFVFGPIGFKKPATPRFQGHFFAPLAAQYRSVSAGCPF
jgi:hypothetical protein